MTEKSIIAKGRETLNRKGVKMFTEEKKRPLRLDIQLMAEDGGEDNGGKETPKTYTEEEYLKLKKAFDDTASELSKAKKSAKEKLTEEEKLAQAQKEKDELLASTQKELLGIKMTKELLVAGFDETTCNVLIESYTKGDSVQFAKDLSTNIKTLIDNVRKEEQTKFQQSGKIPPNGNNNNDTKYDYIKELVPKKSEKANNFFK